MVLSIYKEETIRMKGVCYLGNHICFGKYERLEPVWIRSMSSYKNRKNGGSRLGMILKMIATLFKARSFKSISKSISTILIVSMHSSKRKFRI